MSDFFGKLIQDKSCLILLHGYTHVESWLSINEQILDQNIKEKLLVGQHIACKGIANEGDK